MYAGWTDLGASIFLVIGLVIGFASGWSVMDSYYQTILTQKGLATYCPTTGEFAFIEECNK